ncbi:MAG: NAD-dependent deacylase [Candidatus Auribacterota bacterium]|nr:NAD-dependent deacylase [Candidatus Auribacterota bacterium]
MYDRAAEILSNARRAVAFTGAGISVESGIPPFRGEGGLWNTYDPSFCEIGFFLSHPLESWKLHKEIFFDCFSGARPNEAHLALAAMEKKGLLQAVITQNIDNLHTEAGSSAVYEFHGNSRDLVCVECRARYPVRETDLSRLPPVCKKCGGLLKPDFVFFGEPIPELAYKNSFREAEIADVFILIGTSGEVMPACSIPFLAKQNGASIIEVNVRESSYTGQITDVFLQGKATEVMGRLVEGLGM